MSFRSILHIRIKLDIKLRKNILFPEIQTVNFPAMTVTQSFSHLFLPSLNCLKTKMTMVTVVLVMIIFMSSSSVASPCSFCPVKHTQQHYCDSQVVIKGQVQSQAKVRALAIFKGKEFVFSSKRRRVMSVSIPDCDRFNLVPGKTYLMTGSFYGNRLHIGPCDLVQPWASLTSIQKQGVKDEVYKMFCDKCRINSTYSIIRPLPSSNLDAFWEGNLIEALENPASGLWEGEGCFYNPLASKQYMVDDCETKYSMCVPHENGACTWLPSAKYRTCEQKRETSPCMRHMGLFNTLPSWTCDTDCSVIREECMREMCLRDTAGANCAPRYRQLSFHGPELTLEK